MREERKKEMFLEIKKKRRKRRKEKGCGEHRGERKRGSIHTRKENADPPLGVALSNRTE